MESQSESSITVKPSIIALAVGIGLIYFAFMKPGIWGIDGNDMLQVAISLVTEGKFSVPEGGEGILGRDGLYYSIRYPLQSIAATPFVFIGLTLADWFNLPPRYSATFFALFLPLICTAVSASLVALLAIRLGGKPKGAYLAALSFAFGTTALVYSREFFAEPLLGLLIISCVYLILGKTAKSHALSSILAGLAILAKPTAIVMSPFLSLYLWVKKYPLRSVIGPMLGAAMGTILYLSYNYLRFESITKAGQNTDRFQLSGVFARFLGVLISPGASGGLFWYCPPAILAIFGLYKLYQQQKTDFILIFGIITAYLGLHSFWYFSGWNWGPRFLVAILPLLLALVGILERKYWKWLLILSLIGFVVNSPTLVSYYQRYFAEVSDARQLPSLLALWTPLDKTPFYNVWGATGRQLHEALTTNIQDIINNIGEPPQSGNLANAELLRIVAVWWWVLPAVGIPSWVGASWALMMMGLGVLILWWGWRRWE